MKRKIALILAAVMMLLALTGCSVLLNARSTNNDGPRGNTPVNDNPAATEPAEPVKTEAPAPASNHVVDYRIDIPAGFEEAPMAGLEANWQNADNSSINLTVADAASESDFKQIDADVLKQAMSLQYQAVGYEAEFTDRYFTRDNVCGLPAYQYCFDVTLNGVDMTQIMVCINADKAYSFSYTDASGSWLDQFEASAKNIQLILE